jgi:hypothetical protein
VVSVVAPLFGLLSVCEGFEHGCLGEIDALLGSLLTPA